MGRTVNYISCVFIGYKNIFGPIAVLVTNRFRLEQKSYLLLKSGFGKTTIFNGLLGNCPNVFCWASDYLIWSSFWLHELDISRIWRPSISGTEYTCAYFVWIKQTDQYFVEIYTWDFLPKWPPLYLVNNKLLFNLF